MLKWSKKDEFYTSFQVTRGLKGFWRLDYYLTCIFLFPNFIITNTNSNVNLVS
jgi:hypothetical protein